MFVEGGLTLTRTYVKLWFFVELHSLHAKVNIFCKYTPYHCIKIIYTCRYARRYDISQIEQQTAVPTVLYHI